MANGRHFDNQKHEITQPWILQSSPDLHIYVEISDNKFCEYLPILTGKGFSLKLTASICYLREELSDVRQWDLAYENWAWSEVAL